MVALNKKFYKRRNDLETQGDNIFSRASKNISTLTPIIFGLILGPTVVVSSIISQAAFLMIANILLSVGLSLAFFNRVYQGNAKFLEVILTLGMITALFFLVLYLSPVITGWDLLSVISFINLFASSINSFFLLRTLILPPLLATFKYILGKIGIHIDIHLDKQRDFHVEVDLEKGLKSDAAATELITKNYPMATSENLKDNNWRKIAIKPYNRSKEVIYGYATRYRSTPFGEINNHDKIAERLKVVENIMFNAATDSSHNVLLKNKLIKKSFKVQSMQDDVTILSSSYENYGKSQKDEFIERRFLHVKHHGVEVPTSELIRCLNDNIHMQINKIINLLQCYPLHMAIDLLDKILNKYLSTTHIETIKNTITTDEMKGLYSHQELSKFYIFSDSTSKTNEDSHYQTSSQNIMAK